MGKARARIGPAPGERLPAARDLAARQTGGPKQVARQQQVIGPRRLSNVQRQQQQNEQQQQQQPSKQQAGETWNSLDNLFWVS